MPFELVWAQKAAEEYQRLKAAAESALAARLNASRGKRGKKKSSKQEGLFKQVHKCTELLARDPRHPGLQTHEFHSLEHPYSKDEKVFEAYAQNRTPGAYRVFWCYGPSKGQITIIAITPHP